jgi:DNA-binding MarR family transcriptional regulator
MATKRDAVDHFLAQWRAEAPEVDVNPMGVVGRISRVSRLLEAGIRPTFDAVGLQRSEFDLLATLRRAGRPYRLSAGHLVAAMMVSPAAVTLRADGLIAKGLVTREVDPADRRSVLITLTPAGRRLVQQVVVKHVARERELLAGLSDRELTQLAGLLRKTLLGLGDEAPE